MMKTGRLMTIGLIVVPFLLSAKEPLVLQWDEADIDRDRPMPISHAPVVEKLMPSVVSVMIADAGEMIAARPSERAIPFSLDFENDRERQEYSSGSGAILSKDGIMITNAHVVKGASKCKILLNNSNQLHGAKIIAVDDAFDLALLKIETDEELTPIIFARTDPKVGDIVLALGNPLGIGPTVTRGILSARNRRRDKTNGRWPGRFLQVDAPINPGNSGGPLVDIEGRLIGINTAYLPEAGASIAFAIPAAEVARVGRDLFLHGKVRHGYLGVGLRTLDDAGRDELSISGNILGTLVETVEMDSAADTAGLRPGDVITALDGQPTPDLFWVQSKLSASGPGSTKSLTILRQGESLELSATLSERPPK